MTKPIKKGPGKKAPVKKTATAKPTVKKGIPAKAAKPAKESTIKKPPRKMPTGTRGAPKNNQFWKERKHHGRNKMFETPEELWNAACEYFEWCDKTPLISVEYLGKDARMRKIPKMRAYTWTGLEFYLDIYSLREYKTNDNYKDFSQVITRIGHVMFTQKFEGAAAGFLNANLISSELGLSIKSEIKHSGGMHVVQMTPEEERAIAERLEKEL